MLKPGMEAPNFTLLAPEHKKISLSDFKGQYVVLYFYPKDNTPGCTKQALSFTANANEFHKRGAVVIGISADTIASHEKFIQKHQLTVLLLADEDKKVSESYGVWQQKKNYGRTYMGIERSTFLVDRDGNIYHIWRKVKVKDHHQKILYFLDEQL